MHMNSSTKILFNTGVLYGKMLVTMVFSLLSTRWVLEALGETDFGIYNLVAGLVAMFSFLNTALTVASQRYMSYAIGNGKSDVLSITFYYSILLHLFIAVLIVLLFETIGAFFLDSLLNIPIGKDGDAHFVLHCLAIGTFFTVFAVPYQASANSHENMLIIALISILESILKFLTAILLLSYYGNRLKFYSITFVTISMISFLSIFLYCRKNYRETVVSISPIKDRRYFKEFSMYAVWNLIGALGGMIKTQGIAMIMNIFFGVIVNAAYGIANQLNGQLNFFANTIVKAIQPQLIQNEGAGNRNKMLKLSILACKIPTLLLVMVVIPMSVMMNDVLTIWLKNVPENTVEFCQLVIAYIIVYQSFHGIELSIHACGNIRNYQLVGYGIQLLVLPLGYILFKCGYAPNSILWVSLIGCIVNLFITVYYAHKLASLCVITFFTEYLIPIYAIIIGSYLFGGFIKGYIPGGFLGVMELISINSIAVIILYFFFLVTKEEKKFSINVIKKYTKK